MVSVLARVCNSGLRERKIENVYRGEYSDRLDELIQGDETAKLVYEEKNATRKAKATASNGSRL